MMTRDAWTDAVDFIKAMETLGIESAHVFAASALSVPAAQRMAILWPAMVRSLVLEAISSPDPPQWMQDSWTELAIRYRHAKDIGAVEECVYDFYPIMYGEYLSQAKEDEVALYLETQYPPAKAPRYYDWLIPWLLISRLDPEYLSLIHQPVLIVNGDSGHVSNPEEAALLQAGLPNAAGGAKLVIIPDAPDQLHYIPQFAVQLVEEMIKFYHDLTLMKTRPFMNKEMNTWKRALLELAELQKDPNMKERDPKLATSFSCVTPDVAQMRKYVYEKIHADVDEGDFSPFGPNGELPRKFSERHLDEKVLYAKSGL